MAMQAMVVTSVQALFSKRRCIGEGSVRRIPVDNGYYGRGKQER